VRVQKPYYTSGFLYHSASQKILLQQLNSDQDSKLVMFCEKSISGTDPQTVFKECVEKILGTAISLSSIHPVYDYIHDKLGEHFIFYVEITDVEPKQYLSENKTTWLPLAKLSKQNMSEQTRHDIIVSERVIRALAESAQAPQNVQ
jgi:hypothetical protein